MIKIILLGFLVFNYCSTQNVSRDTIYILFDSKNSGMSKQLIPKEKLTRKGVEPIDDSFVYEIEEKHTKYSDLYDSEYKFSHFNRSKKSYILDSLTYKPPKIIRKNKRFLNKIDLVNNEFFKNTPYLEVCKTFEKNDNREQGVLIFIIDLDEMKNDTIILREVKFTRPIKQ